MGTLKGFNEDEEMIDGPFFVHFEGSRVTEVKMIKTRLDISRCVSRSSAPVLGYIQPQVAAECSLEGLFSFT